MDETTFLSQPGIIVTSTRIDINGQTFAVRNIGSVRVDHKGFSLIQALLGALFLVSGFVVGVNTGGIFMFGIAAVFFALLWQRMNRRKLILVTGGGEVSAYESTNKKTIDDLRTAVAQAISVR
jgi:hypothetical protein